MTLLPEIRSFLVLVLRYTRVYHHHLFTAYSKRIAEKRLAWDTSPTCLPLTLFFQVHSLCNQNRSRQANQEDNSSLLRRVRNSKARWYFSNAQALTLNYSSLFRRMQPDAW